MHNTARIRSKLDSFTDLEVSWRRERPERRPNMNFALEVVLAKDKVIPAKVAWK